MLFGFDNNHCLLFIAILFVTSMPQQQKQHYFGQRK